MTGSDFDPFERGEGFSQKGGDSGNSGGQNPFGFEPVIHPTPPSDPAGRSAQTYGLIGLILTLTCCSLAGLVLGVLAVMRASTSRRVLGFDTANASTGRVLGILAIVFSAIRIISSIASVVLVVCGMLAGLGAGAGAGGTVI